MRCTAFWFAFAIAAASFGCKMDTTPGDGNTVATQDGAIGSTDAAIGGGDAAPVPDGAVPADDGAAGAGGGEGGGEPPGPCRETCPAEAPVCLPDSGECVECDRDRDCDDPILSVCNTEHHTCVQCNADADCSGDTPRCAPESRTCVTCTADVDCGAPERPICDPATHDCVGCTSSDHCGSAAPVCDPAALACVECLVHDDCPTAEKPQCQDNACVPCSGDEACAGRQDATLCNLTPGSKTAGRCVECTVTDESPCGDNVCDPHDLRCTDRARASKQICQPCVADSECVADHRCIAMQFAGAARSSAYCMKRVATGCERPYASSPIRRTSLSGAAAEDYCGIDELKATCEAISGLLADAECSDGTDAACGRDGSICRSVNGLAHRCTYACDAAAQCPSAFSCNSGYCGGPSG